MEQKILDWLKAKHKKQVSISELISEWKMGEREKLGFLGSIKNFQRIKRSYSLRNNRVFCYLTLL